MADQKLTLGVEVKGAAEGAQQLKAVDDAQKGVAQQTEGVAASAKQAADSQRKLSASESDFVGVLTRINPMLGGLCDGLLKGSKIAGDLAAQNVSLTQVFDKATTAVKANAATLKLIGAGGLVAISIYAIARAIGAMKEEAAQAAKAIRDQVAALNELEAARTETMQEEERRSARRREGPAGLDESAAQQRARERLAETVPYTGEDARKDAVMLAGTQAPQDRLQKLAIALDRPGPRGPVDVDRLMAMPAERRERALDRLLERRGGDIAKAQETDAARYERIVEQAVRETRAQGGATFNIEQFIRRLPGKVAAGIEPERLSKIVGALLGTEGSEVPWSAVPGLFGKSVGDVLLKGQPGAYVDLEAKAKLVQGEGVEKVTAAEVRTGEFVLQQLQKAAEKLERAAELQASAPPTVTNHYHNQFSRNTYPDAASQQRHVRNSENLARSRERL